MTLTLAVDTAADFGSIALADENGIREEVPLHAPRGFSYVLFSEIDGLLKRQGVALCDIALFAGASGPGSFTGVRVGLSAIKGLAEVMGKRAVAVSSLEALAQFGTSDARAVVVNAHRGEVYAALYDSAGHQLIPETVVALDRFRAALPDCGPEWISQGFEDDSPLAVAGAIARIAIRRYNAGLAKDPAAIEANYVRRSDAELLWKEA
jgi:tRNA threonylcarbamoyladenosine biosynthesis protein TsaB